MGCYDIVWIGKDQYGNVWEEMQTKDLNRHFDEYKVGDVIRSKLHYLTGWCSLKNSDTIYRIQLELEQNKKGYRKITNKVHIICSSDDYSDGFRWRNKR